MFVVSACLAGRNCRYDGKSNEVEEVKKLVDEGEGIMVCPEQMGGLPTPRIPSEIKDGRVINKEGLDVTKEFKNGAKIAFDIAKKNNCTKAILKSRSPSCGFGCVYDGTFTGTRIQGDGIFARMLVEAGIEVLTEEDLKRNPEGGSQV